MRKLLLTLAFLLPTMAQADTEIVGKDWGGYTIEWSSGSQLIARYGIFEENGMFKVCVATTSRRSVPFKLVKEALRKAYIELENGNKIARDLRFAKIYSSRYADSAVVGQEAPCKVTKTPINSLRTRLVFPKGRYSYEG